MTSGEENVPAAVAAAPVAPALNLAPTKKTEIDIFARAPQVRKMTRKDKQRLALAAAMGEGSAKKKSGRNGGAGVKSTDSAAGDSASPDSKVSADLFATVFAEELAATGVANDDALAKKTTRASGRKKSKKQVLRHALHKNEEEDVRTVFVGNLPNTIDKKHVTKVFKDCGAIESVRVRSQALENPNAAAAKSSTTSPAGQQAAVETSAPSRGPVSAPVGKKDVGRAVRVLRGEIKKDPKCSATAYVLFEDAASVAVAIERKNGVVFQGRHLVVTALGAESAAYPPETSIFLGNVAYNTSEEDVWNFFTEQGITDVKRVRLVRDRDSGDCKGFGYVEFSSKASVEPAIATRGALLNGRELRIVHVNKSKDVKAITASRREKRARSSSEPGSARGDKERSVRGRTEASSSRSRAPQSRRSDSSGPSRKSTTDTTPSWMGLTTNPRRKVPRDLRSLTETNADRKFKGPRPPVKRKMRNPEK